MCMLSQSQYQHLILILRSIPLGMLLAVLIIMMRYLISTSGLQGIREKVMCIGLSHDRKSINVVVTARPGQPFDQKLLHIEDCQLFDTDAEFLTFLTSSNEVTIVKKVVSICLDTKAVRGNVSTQFKFIYYDK